jgi:hypothetical protein
MSSRQSLVSHIHPPYLYATYHCVDELVTPYLEVLLFGHVRGRKQLEEIEDRGLGLVEEGSHCWLRWLDDVESDKRVVMCNEATM